MNFEEEAVAKRINKKVTMTKKTTAVCLLRKSFKNHHLYYCHNSRKREREREKNSSSTATPKIVWGKLVNTLN